MRVAGRLTSMTRKKYYLIPVTPETGARIKEKQKQMRQALKHDREFTMDEVLNTILDAHVRRLKVTRSS